MAAWVEEYQGSTDDLPRAWANLYANGAWGAAFQLSAGLAHSPAVALNASGNGVAVYVERSYDANDLMWNDTLWARRDANGAWSAAERVGHTPATDSGLYAREPQVGVDDAGNIIAAWVQSDTTNVSDYDGVFASRYDGSAWSAPERLDTFNACTGSNYLDTVLQLRLPCGKRKPDGLRGHRHAQLRLRVRPRSQRARRGRARQPAHDLRDHRLPQGRVGDALHPLRAKIHARLRAVMASTWSAGRRRHAGAP